MVKSKPLGFFAIAGAIVAFLLNTVPLPSPTVLTASPPETSFDPSEPQFDPFSSSFDPFAIEVPCQELGPFTVEIAYREHVFTGEYETRDKIELSGAQVLKIKNKMVVVNGDITLSGSARLVVENSYLLWNNSYFAEYMGFVRDSATLEVKHSVLVRGDFGNMNVYVSDGASLTMENTISFFDLYPGNSNTIIDSSQLIGTAGVSWAGDEPTQLKIMNSRVRQINVTFSKGEPEEVRFPGLRWGGPQSVSVSTLEGASLEVENSWVGGVSDIRGGWVFDINEVAYVEDPNWELGTPVPDNAELGWVSNRKHYIIEDSEIDSFWLWFKGGSKVKIANWKTGHVGYWNLHENAEVQGVGYDFTIENTSLTYVKWLICGEAEIENNENIQVSPYGRNVLVLVTNSDISHNVNMRGNENIKLVNCSVPSTILFLDARRLYAAGGHIHYLDFENTTISGTIDVASTYSRISGTVTILVEKENVNYDWGTIEREYPAEVRDENSAPVGNVEVSLFDPENNLVWSGTTDQDGSASFDISFTENNWNRKWRLETAINGGGISREIGFLTSTPIVLSVKPENVSTDADGDGMPDEWETQHGLNPNTNDANQDKDGDGYTNLQEYLAGTDSTLASSYPGAEYEVPPVNQPPTADAGGPYSVGEGETVELDGAGSSDPNGAIAGYSWTITDDPTGGASLTDADTATPTFHAPESVDEAVDVTVRLTVEDDEGATDSYTATVTVQPAPSETPYAIYAGAILIVVVIGILAYFALKR